MNRAVYIGGGRRNKYHVDPLCQNAPGYDRRFMSEEVAKASGYQPCRTCALDRVRCAASRCGHFCHFECTKHRWTGAVPQEVPVAGCLDYCRLP